MALLTIIYVVMAVLNDDTRSSTPPVLLLALSVLFLTEFALRCWDAPSRGAYLRGHWLDLVSCIPLIGGLRAIRLLRLLRLGAAMRVLLAVEQEARRRARERESLWFVLPAMVLLWTGSAYAMWVLEHGKNPNIKTFLDALYWSFITVTTVGYGDISPVTVGGRIVSGLLVFVGIGLLGFVSARLTALWLRQETRHDPVAEHLEALRAEVAELRQVLLTHHLGSQDTAPNVPSVEVRRAEATPDLSAEQAAR